MLKVEGDGGGEERKQEEERDGTAANGGDGVVVITLDLDESGGGQMFDLEKAVCSHGLFMMAPNRWDVSTKTLSRPLRIDPQTSLLVSISHHHHFQPQQQQQKQQQQQQQQQLRICVFGTTSLAPPHRHAIVAQVKRMLRLSDEERTMLRDFHKIHPSAAEKGLGRIFRSPTLFEDMIKCILLCNCQWSRTLSMAKELCELQLELKHNMHILQPRTPQKKDLKKKPSKRRKLQVKPDKEAMSIETESFVGVKRKGTDSSSQCDSVKRIEQRTIMFEQNGHYSEDVFSCSLQGPKATCNLGDFPTAEELAGLEEEYLSKRCVLGYRAKRIVSLAKSVVGKKIQLKELEELCDRSSNESYKTLSQKLLAIDGFGPFTCANILMCMGYYHKIPSDSETIRHLKQIHLRSCTMRTIDEDLKKIYGKYAPFQFLAYWTELWEFYETRFGKMSEMPFCDYQLITASNMKVKRSK